MTNKEYIKQQLEIIDDYNQGKITSSDRDAYLDDLWIEYKFSQKLAKDPVGVDLKDQ